MRLSSNSDSHLITSTSEQYFCLGETTASINLAFQVKPGHSDITLPPTPAQTPIRETKCTAYALQGYLSLKCLYSATHKCRACQYPICEGHTTQCALFYMQPLCHHCSTPRPGHATFMCDPLRCVREEQRATAVFRGKMADAKCTNMGPAPTTGLRHQPTPLQPPCRCFAAPSDTTAKRSYPIR